MKAMKKILAVLLTLTLVAALIPAALAEDTGKITITNAVKGETYTVYKVFDAIGNGTAISYAVRTNHGTAVPTGFEADAAGNVSYTGNATELTADDIAAIADYVTVADIVQTKIAGEDALEFTGIADGYYYITTTTGTVVTINSANHNATVTDKNEGPSIDKEVQEDSDRSWGNTNDADIGQTVCFRTTVTAQPGARNYVVHDKMGAGLTFDSSSVGIDGLTKGTDYTVSTNCTDGCTFEIVFDQDYLDTIDEEDTEIVITYSAVLNEDAEISTNSNDNETKLTWGNAQTTQWIKTQTYTFKFDLVKTDGSNIVLNGAKFELYTAETGGTKIAVIKDGDVYRPIVTGETGEKIEAGQATIVGLDGGTTYYLEETDAPDGYNKLTERKAVQIAKANLTASVETIDQKPTYKDGGVRVINQAGIVLPTTGGIGTTLFYVFGSILVIGAGVLLVTKKRMGAAE